MILASVILLPLLAISFWLFVRAHPKEQYKKAMVRFNAATLAVVIASCAVVFIYFWQTTGQSVDRAWWPMLALFASIFATVIILVVAALIRAKRFRGEAA